MQEALQMIEMKAVLAGNAALKQLAAVRKEWRAAMKEEGVAIKAEYDKTHATWDTPVQFRIKVRPTKDGEFVEVSASNRIYWFVHESIKVMRGVLSSDWSPKTKPRVLSSGAGSGRLLYASKKISKPPYEARKFTEEIVKVRQKPFEKRMQHATAVGARKATQGG
jgi:hypothetical protein